MKLIPNWKKAWKFTSVQVAALLTVLAFLQAGLPDLQTLISADLYAYVNFGLGLLVILARVWKQSMEEANGAD
jgi:hypothetical protein